MLDKLFGKKQKGIQVFNIPEKKYCMDQKKLLKMDRKQLTEVICDMQKYIICLCQKLQNGKKQYERSLEYNEQIGEKERVLNGQMSRINNQHEELQVKFTNLQSSLQFMIQERELILQTQAKYIEQNGLSKQKIKGLNKIFEIYHSQLNSSQKISQQNKQLKQKLTDSQSEYHSLSEKFNQMKVRSDNSYEKLELQLKSTSQDGEEKQSAPRDKTLMNRLQSIVEGKQQMIISLNKQIAAQRSKLAQHTDKIEELNEGLQEILKQIQLKDEQLTKLKQENGEHINIINGFKKGETKFKANQEKYQQELDHLGHQVRLLENEVYQLRNNYSAIVAENKVSIDKYEKKLADSVTLINNFNKQNEKIKGQLQKKQLYIENIKIKLTSYQAEIMDSEKRNSELKRKEIEIAQIKKQLQLQKNKNQQMKKQIQKIEQECQIKINKSQFTANQQRIKAETLKRSLTQVQTKDEQNRKNLDDMYETKIVQDGKIVQMEKKLKQYKHLIQYLRKEKIELEKTFQNKIKNMEQMVINEVEDQEQGRQPNSAKKQHPNFSPSPRVVNDEEFEKQVIMTQKKIADLEEQIDLLKEQNMNLKAQKQNLLQGTIQMQNKLKCLTQKRQEVMREIKKMTGQNLNQMPVKKEKANMNTEEVKCREKKIAEKAYKGFDILAKLLSTLYKQFITIHLSDIGKKQVKQIQGSINSIVRKSLDMKDIFQDYI